MDIAVAAKVRTDKTLLLLLINFHRLISA